MKQNINEVVDPVGFLMLLELLVGFKPTTCSLRVCESTF